LNSNILLTGFEVFNEYPVNSSWEVAVEAARTLPSFVHCKRFPVDFFAAKDLLRGALDELKPSICLLMGMGNEDFIQIEQLAHKPDCFETTLSVQTMSGFWPWQELAAVFEENRLPFRFSKDAGNYVCESTYWSLLEYRATRGFPTFAAFLHIPPIEEILLIDRVVKAVREAILKRIPVIEENR
jgi:pyroglutamyl-peptidase